MNELIYERLAQSGLIKAGHVNTEQIASAPLNTLLDLALEISLITSAENMERESAAFAHSASLSLAGGTGACETLECRIQRIRELTQFAVLYSDRIYIRNTLADYIPHTEGSEGAISSDETTFRESFIRERFTIDLIILNEIRPVVEKGIIVPFTPPLNFCPHCLAKRSLGQDADARFQELKDYLNHRYFNEVSIELQKGYDEYFLEYEGPESLIDHGKGVLVMPTPPNRSFPARLQSIKQAVRKADMGGTVALSPSARRKVGLNAELANKAILSICFELVSAQSFGTSFLTDRPVHIDALGVLSANSELERRNSIAREYLTSILPFVEGVPVDDIIRLREAEGEAFIVYRQALNQAIDEYRARGSDFMEKDARQLYGDIIAPRLAALDGKVKSAKKTLLKDPGITTAAWIGAITFGMYSGFVPPDLVMAAKALGLTHIVANLLKSAISGVDTEQHIRGEDLYFLWKVRQKRRS